MPSAISVQQAISKVGSLKWSRDATQRRIQGEMALIQNLQHSKISLQQDLADATAKSDEAKTGIDSAIIEIQNCEDQINSLNPSIQAVQEQINQLEAILREQAPEEKWGNYCVNGHLNCPNLPSQVHQLGNQAEIDAYKERMEQTRSELQEKLQELANLNAQVTQLQNQESSLKIQIDNYQGRLYSANQSINYAQNAIANNQKSQEYENQNLARLQNDLQQYEDMIQDAEQQVENAKRAEEDAQQKRREQLAQREKQARARRNELSRYLFSQPDTASEEQNSQPEPLNNPTTRYAEIATLAAQELAGLFSEGTTNFLETAQKLISNETDNVRQAVNNARDAIRTFESRAESVAETAWDFFRWGGQGTLSGLIANRMEEIAEISHEETNNYLVDEDAQIRRP